jgi:hypothetical protein
MVAIPATGSKPAVNVRMNQFLRTNSSRTPNPATIARVQSANKLYSTSGNHGTLESSITRLKA